MTTTDLDEVARYAAAVRAELGDLPAQERDELLGDLEDHLREVAADTEGSLVGRIGPAHQYAQDLRASAGLLSGDPLGRARWSPVPAPVRRYWRAFRDHTARRATAAFLQELRPAWWLLRAYVLVQVLARLTVGIPMYVIPNLQDNRLIGFIAVITACVASVQLGRHTVTSRQARALLVVANTLLAIVTALAAVQLADDALSGL